MKLWRTLRRLFGNGKVDTDMTEEMRAHLELQEAAYRREGMPREEARYAARRAFGGVEQIKESARNQRGWRWLEDFIQDVRIGIRVLAKERGFVAICVVVLALGIGANTAIFSVIDAVLLRPLPIHEPERVVRVWESNPARRINRFSVSYQNYNDWVQRSRSWQSLAAVDHRNVNLLTRDEPVRLRALVTMSNAPALFEWRASLGRLFAIEDDQPGRGRVAVLSDALWRRRFDADPAVLGREITIDGQAYSVIGVMAAGQGLATDAEILLPLRPFVSPDRTDHELDAYGRLAEGVSLAQAREEMVAVARAIEREHPEENAGWSVRTETLIDSVVEPKMRQGLRLVAGAVALLLVITCGNLSSLLLVRATKRARELAIRTALGGGRGRLVRQLTTESLLLAGLGGLAGVVLAAWSVDAIRALEAVGVPRASTVTLDGRVLAFALLATVLTGLVAGVLPALVASRIDVQRGLAGSGGVAGPGRHRVRTALIVTQLALSIVLLAAAGLILRAVARLHETDLGFRPEHVLTARIAPKNGQGRVLIENLVERVRHLPGVQSVGAISNAPMSAYNTSTNVFPVGRAAIPTTESVQSEWRIVTADYFRAMQIPVKRGRVFTPADNAAAGRVVVVSETLARILWGNDDPIGRQINPGGGTRYSTVIGVVGDVRSRNPGTPPAPAYYLSAHSAVWGMMTLTARTTGDVDALVSLIRGELRALDPTLPLFDVQTLKAMIGRTLAPQRTVAFLLGTFALLALALAASGLYGVMAHATGQRTREIGIRLALGAQRWNVIAPLIRDGLRLIALGVSSGLLLAVVAGGVMQRVTGVASGETAALVGTAGVAAGVLAAIAFVACYVPARRASKVDPMVALRAE